MQVQQDMRKPDSERFILHAELPTKTSNHMLLVCADPAMLQWAAKYGHARVMSMDTTFGLTQYGYSFLTVTVVHEGKGKPAMFALMSSESGDEIFKALQVLEEHVKKLNPDWCPSSFMIDDSNAERNGIECAADPLASMPAILPSTSDQCD